MYCFQEDNRAAGTQASTEANEAATPFTTFHIHSPGSIFEASSARPVLTQRVRAKQNSTLPTPHADGCMEAVRGPEANPSLLLARGAAMARTKVF